MKRFSFLFFFVVLSHMNFAQDTFFKDVLKANREKLYRNLVNNTINSNLSLPLTDSTEEQWQDAFWAMELINYHSPWVENRVRTGMEGIQNRSISFQRAMLELIYTNYPEQFTTQVEALLLQTGNTKIFAMCAIYLLKNVKNAGQVSYLAKRTKKRIEIDPDDPILSELVRQLLKIGKPGTTPSIHPFLEKEYLPGKTLLISFQRQNRNYPGLVMVRDTSGYFVKDDAGNFFAIAQLARSISNMPGYLTNGNTPEGIFRMDGFDHSKSSFIGPTTNIQLTMPFEFKPSHFYKDSTLTDSSWDINMYKNMLPENFRNHIPMYQSYYAGKAGRTEIIAHGTTVDPGYYKGMSYYPLTPTQGCLCTKELWNETTGKLSESDQQKLATAITKAGGPDGYAIVINIDNRQEPVSLNDIIPFLDLAMQK